MSHKSTLPKRLRPMLATLTDAPFDDPDWVFEDKYDGFRMVAEIRHGSVALYSRNGKIISHAYIEIAEALEGVKGDAVIDGELVAVGKDGVSHFQLLQNALRHQAKLLYCTFDLMFENGEDLRSLPLLERKKRLEAIRLRWPAAAELRRAVCRQRFPVKCSTQRRRPPPRLRQVGVRFSSGWPKWSQGSRWAPAFDVRSGPLWGRQSKSATS